jgi:hypothetical protein
VPLDKPVSTDVLLVDVVEVYEPSGVPSGLVAISELVLRQRPPH